MGDEEDGDQVCKACGASFDTEEEAENHKEQNHD